MYARRRKVGTWRLGKVRSGEKKKEEEDKNNIESTENLMRHFFSIRK
jgi:hypothetical protein